ncbi:DUF6241 domain-containing protein [Peribacillus frigoritolerans]|uniref:DUF6241 domain-containing protein n=1 Tax=Peribacillus frigoritolerans TaxID=450367 RepID=UPI002225DCE7|nr:DUF6241 domain-containing protein [Peribacillus frigoritolerans]MCY9139792.1 DUF6241 domain-containing protein [Peribacillus frigoritolerans]UYZ01170.1 DUF6241 domain-containing protein [Peribacillus frigoritolerans]
MNKFRWSMVGLIVAAAAISVIITINQNSKNYEAKQEDTAPVLETTEVEYEATEEDDAEVESIKNEKILYELGLGPASKREDVMKTMHAMTHQKVVSEEKWYNYEMNSENINAVYDFINDSETIDYKSELLRIVGKWKEGNFDNIVEVHNYLWGEQNGNVGKATGVLTPEEEAQFVKLNFE